MAFNHLVETGATDVYFEDGGNFGLTACAQIAIIGSKLWIDTMSDICVPQSVNLDGISELNNKKLIAQASLASMILPEQKDSQIRKGFVIACVLEEA